MIHLEPFHHYPLCLATKVRPYCKLFRQNGVILTSDGWNKGGNGSRRASVSYLDVAPPSRTAKPNLVEPGVRGAADEAEADGCEEHCRRRVSGRASDLGRKGTRPRGGVCVRPARCGLHASRDDSRNVEGRPTPFASSSSSENPNRRAWLPSPVEASSFVRLRWRVCLSLLRSPLVSAPT